jgi:hypothetical protein
MAAVDASPGAAAVERPSAVEASVNVDASPPPTSPGHADVPLAATHPHLSSTDNAESTAHEADTAAPNLTDKVNSPNAKALPPAPSADADADPQDTTAHTGSPNAVDAAETMSESPSASEWEKVEKPISPIKPAGSAVPTNKLESPFRRRESQKQNGGREGKEESPIGRKVGEVRRVLKEGMFGGEWTGVGWRRREARLGAVAMAQRCPSEAGERP